MSGFDNDVLYADNVDFTGGSPVTGQMTANGQLLIGAGVAPFIRAATLTAGTGISITNGAGTITITNTGGGGGGGGTESLMGNSGSATEVGGVINVIGSTGITTSGATDTLTISPANDLAALEALSGTGYVVRTGSETYTTRTFIAGTGITISNADGVAAATTINASAAVPTTFTEDAGSATPAANNLNILGTSAQGISTSGAGATVTITAANASAVQKGVASFNSTNFTVSSGAVTSNALTVTAGTGLTTGGSVNLGGSVTLDLDVPVTVPHGGTGQTTLAANTVVYGNNASAVGSTNAGTNGQLLIAATGAAPAFATVLGTNGITFVTGANALTISNTAIPNSALANSSITVNAGSGISVVGSPVSLGGSVTISATGAIPTTFTADSGSAVPSGNNLNILGTVAQGISTSGSGATITLTVANATTSQKGVVALATNAEAIAGTDTAKAITADDLKAKLGVQTLNGVPYGGGTTAAINWLGAATNGQLIIGSTGAAPVLGSLTQPAAGLTITGGAGTITFALANDLAALEGLATTGVAVRTGTSTWTTRTLTAGSGISISNGDGVSGNPTISATGGGGSSANSTLDYFDDFIYYGATVVNGSGNGVGPWISNGFSTPVMNDGGVAVAGHPGTCTLRVSAVNDVSFLSNQGAATDEQPFVLGGGVVTLTWYFKINTLSTSSQRYILELGFADEDATMTPNAGAYLRYVDNVNSGQWQYVTANAGSRTTTNSSTAVATGWQVVQIVVNAAATSVEFFAGTTLAGLVSLGTANSTNIPTSQIAMGAGMNKTVGSSQRTVDLDLVTLNIALTSAR